MSVNGPRNYNLRSNVTEEQDSVLPTAEEVIPAEQIHSTEEESLESEMATGLNSFRLEKFRGDGTDRIEDFIKKFDRYVNLCNIKPEQRYDLLCLQLEGRAQWYLDSLDPAPADLTALKAALLNKFKDEKQIKMDIFKMKKLDIESINDFVYRVEKETHKLNLPTQLQVQIAVGGLDPNVQSAISSHGPKDLDEVRKLANRVQQPVAAVNAVAAPQDRTLSQILELLQKLTLQNTPGAPRQQQQRPETTIDVGRRMDPCQGCGGFLWKGPKLMTWTFLCIIMVSAVAAEPVYFQRLNYGIVFEPESQLHLGQESWLHTFEISLPTNMNIIEISGCNHDENTCIIINQILSQINEVRMQTKQRLNTTLETVSRLVPEKESAPKSRGKRSLFGFVGKLSKSIFGTATVDDVNKLVRHINALKKETSKVVHAVQHHEQDLSSYMRTANERMTNLKKGIEQNYMAIAHIHTQLQGSFKTLEQSIISMNGLVTRQIQESEKLETILNELVSGVYDLVEGRLSPSLLPVDILQHTMNEIQTLMHMKYPGFHLTAHTPAQIYENAKFVYLRHDSKLYLTVKFPMSPHAKPLSLFKVLSYAVPVNDTSNHATQILDLPEFFALTHDLQFYTTFQHVDFSACMRTPHLVCQFNKALSPATQETCIMALFANDKKLVNKHCNFRVLLNHLLPTIIEISKSSILVYKSPILELDCKTGKRMIKGCNFCILSIPCECGVTTPQLYLPPRLAACQNHSQSVTKMHPINLAMLQQFFDSPYLQNITGDSMYQILPDVDLPHFKVYNHSMSSVLADDRKIHLSLDKMAQKAKKDAVIFQSLTEPLLDGEITLDPDWFSTSNIMLFATMGVAATCLVALILIFLRLRKLTIMFQVLQSSVGKASANSLPSFHYKSPVTQSEITSSLFDNLQLSWEHGIFVISALTLIIIIIYFVYKCLSKTKSNTILLELTSGSRCVFIPVKCLPLCPSFWDVHLPSTIKSIDVQGVFFPTVYFEWSDFKIINKTNEKTVIVENIYRLNPIAAYVLRQLIKKPYDAYFYWSHGNWLEPIHT